ncbi:MAG: glycosyltransferase [Candidatus Promineifilaceae bacterium]|nr:glycosyltransferase [Candidatus Promineifilaceae bacterium]
MYLAIVGGWFAASVVLWIDLVRSLHLLESGWGKAAAVLLTLLIDVGWLYGAYHLGILSFTLLRSRSGHREQGSVATDGRPSSPIAILHTVCDDFQSRAVASCVAQDYPDFHVYLLDDSSTAETRREVDAFSSQFVGVVTVLRRDDRRGFKAGNLNHALAQLPSRYRYIALADSDTFLPRDFLRKTAGLLERNRPAAFVQALHVANVDRQRKLAQDLGDVVRIGWNYYQPVRNEYGFPICYGHGALLSADALRAAGGFPEIVSEDVALTLRLRTLGFWGFFTSDVICGEDYPGDYHTFRKRFSRWAAADLECLREALLPFLSAANVSVTEKMDASLRGLKVPLAASFLPFSAALTLFPILSPDSSALLGPYTFGLTLLMGLAGYYCFVVDKIRRPKSLFLLISRLTAVFLSNSLLLTARTVETLVSGRADFYVTGAAYEKVRANGHWRQLLSADEAGYPFLGLLEVAGGLSLLALGIYQINLILVGIAAALLLAPVAYALGWQHRAVSVLAHGPFLLLVLGIVLSCFAGQVPQEQLVTLACLSILLF